MLLGSMYLMTANLPMPHASAGFGSFQEVLGFWRFDPNSASEGKSRACVQSVLEQHEHLMDDIALATSELVANAVVHAQSDLHVVVELWQHMIRIGVVDASPAPPVLQNPDTTSEGGRGLFIVDAIADTWGFDYVPSGKCVWAGFSHSGG